MPPRKSSAKEFIARCVASVARFQFLAATRSVRVPTARVRTTSEAERLKRERLKRHPQWTSPFPLPMGLRSEQVASGCRLLLIAETKEPLDPFTQAGGFSVVDAGTGVPHSGQTPLVLAVRLYEHTGHS